MAASSAEIPKTTSSYSAPGAPSSFKAEGAINAWEATGSETSKGENLGATPQVKVDDTSVSESQAKESEAFILAEKSRAMVDIKSDYGESRLAPKPDSAVLKSSAVITPGVLEAPELPPSQLVPAEIKVGVDAAMGEAMTPLYLKT